MKTGTKWILGVGLSALTAISFVAFGGREAAESVDGPVACYAMHEHADGTKGQCNKGSHSTGGHTCGKCGKSF